MPLFPTTSSSTKSGELCRRRSVSSPRLRDFRSSRTSVCSKALLFAVAVMSLDIGGSILPIGNSIDSSGSITKSFGFILPVAASSDPCSELDIPKPLRFGKREAYIDRYKLRCNNKRFPAALSQEEQIQQIQEEMTRAIHTEASLLKDISKLPQDTIVLLKKLSNQYHMGSLGNVLRSRSLDDLFAVKKELMELRQMPNDFAGSS